MAYLMGKSYTTGNIYTGNLPKDCHLEPDDNRVWEIEITEDQFNKIGKSAEMSVILLGERVIIYKVE